MNPRPHLTPLAGLIAAGLLATTSLVAAQPAAPAPNAFDCMIEASQTVEVRSPVAGLIEQVHVRRGDSVRAGQLLVSIESSVERSAADAAQFRAQAQGALTTARHKLEAAREKARRMRALAAEEFVSTQARDDAEAEMRVAESELKSAEEANRLAQLEHRQAVDQLGRRQIRSPLNGVVIDQYLFPGALVDGGEGRKPILKIAQTQPLLVQALLPFSLFKRVRVGQTLTVTPERPFDGAIAATVRTVDRVVDSAAGTFGIVAQLPNATGALPAGIRCRVALTSP